MVPLDSKYQNRIDEIIEEVQNSELLATYLEEEEFEDYKLLTAEFEPKIQELYKEVAENDPLQILSLETALLDQRLEGLFMPKLVGYSVLRGEVNDQFMYRKPQDQFKKVIEALTTSSNFDMIKLRVGQSIHMGFALSSDIWITNIINAIKNTRVRNFLMAQKNRKYINLNERKEAAKRYKKQFATLNYYTAVFPQTVKDLKSNFHEMRTFLLQRGKMDYDNSSLAPYLTEFIANDALKGQKEYLKLILIIGLFFDLDDKGKKAFAEAFDYMKKNNPHLTQDYFNTLKEMVDDPEIKISPDADKRLSQLIAGHGTEDINVYYELMHALHTKGFVHEEVITMVQDYYNKHLGLSANNECLRAAILNYCAQVMDNLDPTSYQDYFEINKTFVQYIHIFDNEKFNQEIKKLSLNYIKKLLKHYTDKRGRDYQDIKKFVKATFTDLGFMNDKELIELFKTRRKKRTKLHNNIDN